MTAEFVRIGDAAAPARHQLLVDGEPFIVLGGQVHNSSAWPAALDRAWPQLVALGANTAEVPVYWEQLEHAPGSFDFSLVDHAVAGARAHGLRLILLWFGTWKNGVADFAPRWVKDDPATYPLMRDAAGHAVRVLSPHAEATRDADARAFAALMRHLREIDGDRGTVIMVQVENEPGSLFTDRDYGADAERAFHASVPAAVAALSGGGSGTWTELLGPAADETFAAWHVARFVNAVAEAGRAEYALPLSVNVWLKERKGFMRPGVEYPSGVPVSHLIDLWKRATPAIDVIAPDVYVLDYVGYRQVCETYARADNALLIPETGGTTPFAGYLFYALGDFGATGWAPFGIDRQDGPPGEVLLDERLHAVRDSFRLLGPAVAEISRLQARGALRAAVEQQHLSNVLLPFDDLEALVEFGPLAPGYGGLTATGTPGQTGRVLVGRRAAREFLVAGFDARVTFRSTGGGTGDVQFLAVEEGAFEGGVWTVRRRLNGDQTFFGARLPSGGAMLRVEIAPLV